MEKHSDSLFRPAIIITGFGPFGNIKVNPSSAIAQQVAAFCRDHYDLPYVEFTDLETSIEATTTFFNRLEKTLAELIAVNPKQKILLLHLGVNTREKNGVMQIEIQGYNQLFASIPDARGVLLNNTPICSEDGGVDISLRSWFCREGSPVFEKFNNAVEHMNSVLEKRKASVMEGGKVLAHQEGTIISELKCMDTTGSAELVKPIHQLPTWLVSRDAGRYLCNFCLYLALKMQEKFTGNVAAIFVHVCDPMDEPKQGKTSLSDSENHGEISNSIATMKQYNPTLMEQIQQVEQLLVHLLDMMKDL